MVKYNFVQLETSHTVILPPMVSVVWSGEELDLKVVQKLMIKWQKSRSSGIEGKALYCGAYTYADQEPIP